MSEKFPSSRSETGEAPEWLRAKEKGLDMRKEAVTKRADELFPTRMYHGTFSVFDEFDLAYKDTGVGRSYFDAVWISSDPKMAEWYAMYPFRDSDYYLICLMRKTGRMIQTSEKEEQAFADFVTAHPKLKEAKDALDALLTKHQLSKKTPLATWFSKPGLRNEILEAAEQVAKAFNAASGTAVELRPVVMPLRVDLRGAIERDANAVTLNHTFNQDTVQDAIGKARKRGAPGVVMLNAEDGATEAGKGIVATVAGITDRSRIRSVHAVFDPDLKNEPGLMN